MMELAQIAAKQTSGGQYSVNHRALKLPRTRPSTTFYTVYARAIDPKTQGDGASRVGFALEENATEWYTRGVRWKFEPDEIEYGLFICFVLVDGIEELELPKRPDGPPFWFSTTWTPSSRTLANQMCCTPLVPNTKTRYHFRAKLTSGEYVDPIIIVNPINSIGDADKDDVDDDEHDRLSLATVHDTRTGSAGRERVLSIPPADLLLPLPEGGAFTVDVKISNDGPVFSLPPSPPNPQFLGGVTWTASKTFPGVTLTFQFPTVEITRLLSTSHGLTFSQPIIVGHRTLQTCHLTATSAPVQYSFDVMTPSGTTVRGIYDPIIIVNPINSLDD
jgi:hypothetical protein